MTDVKDADKKAAKQKEEFLKLHEIMDVSAKKAGIYFNAMSAEGNRRGALSTDTLTFDLLLGGGIMPGRFLYYYGPTGSCKTTLLYQALKDPIKRGIICDYLDYEASLDVEYVEALGLDWEHLQGFRNKKGVWERRPQLYYSTPQVLEDGFDHIRSLLLALPFKIMMEDDNGPRYFRIRSTYAWTRSWPSINKGLASGDVEEVDDASPQMVIGIDSIAAMTPKVQADNFDNEQPGILAAALHKRFRSIKSLLGDKMVNLMATNHMNTNPMARFCSPETEPGGNAVKYYPDYRVNLNVRHTNKAMVDQIHVSGFGYDRYLPGRAKIDKNKNGTAHRTMDFMVWVNEQGDRGHGICPVFDTYNYLVETKQLEVLKDGSYKMLVQGFDESPLTYAEFKKFVLADERYLKLRAALTEQLASGKGQELYYENVKDRASKAKKSAKKGAFGAGHLKVVGGDEEGDEGGDDDYDSELETEVEV